ncbi:MAG: MOSC domain-containing protein [Thermomicrobiales bacterium]
MIAEREQSPVRTIGLRAVAVGMPAVLGTNRQGPVISGIRKHVVEADEIFVGRTDLAGDGQADLRAHGGPDKAVYCYPSDHRDWWAREHGYVGVEGEAPFGENLSTLGITEQEVCIGDQWRWGDALLEVSQPRWPCFKLAMMSGRIDMVQRFVASGRSGWYLRVLEEGVAPVAGPIELVARDPLEFSVHLAFAIRTNGDAAAAERVFAHPKLAAAWKP